MAGDWIKMRTNLEDDPRVIEMAASLKADELHVVGMLWKVWAWADDHTLAGNAMSVTEVTLDRFTRAPGFAVALRKAGWLEGRDGALTFPRFAEHNGQTAKNRALTAKRVSECKKRKGNGEVTMGALPREEKRREEKREDNSHTHGDGKPFVASEAKQEGLRLPKDADTPRNREMLELWQKARQQNNGHKTPTAVWEAEAMIHAGWTEETWFRSLQFSASKGSLSLLDPDNDFQKRKPQSKERKSAVLSPEELDKFKSHD